MGPHRSSRKEPPRHPSHSFSLLRIGRALRLQRIGSLNEGMSFNPFSWADLLDRDGVQIVVDTTFILVAIGLAAARYLL